MKILCCFTGSIRLDIDRLIFYITEFKKHFETSNFEIKYLFLTDGNTSSIKYYNTDYAISEISKYCDVKRIETNHSLTSNLINGYPIKHMCSYFQAMQDYIKYNSLEFDYIIHIRNDLLIRIDDITKYFDTFTYVPPRYWYNRDPYNLSNNHLFIIPFAKFMNIDLSTDILNKKALTCYDAEQLNLELITPDKVINDQNIKEYLLNGDTKMHIKNSKLIMMGKADPCYSFLFYK